MLVSTHDPLILSLALVSPIFSVQARSQVSRSQQTPPPRFLHSLVRDPRGPPHLLRIREDFLNNALANYTTTPMCMPTEILKPNCIFHACFWIR